MTNSSTITIPDNFQKRFPDDQSCFQFLSDKKWKDGFKCPYCGHHNYCRGKRQYDRQCTSCHRSSSPTSGTLFHMIKFSLLKAFQLIYIISNNDMEISSTALSLQLGLRQKTCWLFKKKIMKAMENNQDLEAFNLVRESGKKKVSPTTNENRKGQLFTDTRHACKKVNTPKSRSDSITIKRINFFATPKKSSRIVSYIKKKYQKVRTPKASTNRFDNQPAFEIILSEMIHCKPLLYRKIRKKAFLKPFNSPI